LYPCDTWWHRHMVSYARFIDQLIHGWFIFSFIVASYVCTSLVSVCAVKVTVRLDMVICLFYLYFSIPTKHYCRKLFAKSSSDSGLFGSMLQLHMGFSSSGTQLGMIYGPTYRDQNFIIHFNTTSMFSMIAKLCFQW
jgi:hypothetical protein